MSPNSYNDAKPDGNDISPEERRAWRFESIKLAKDFLYGKIDNPSEQLLLDTAASIDNYICFDNTGTEKQK